MGAFEITEQGEPNRRPDKRLDVQVSHFCTRDRSFNRQKSPQICSSKLQTTTSTESHPGNSTVTITVACCYKRLEHILQKVVPSHPPPPLFFSSVRKNKQTVTVPVGASGRKPAASRHFIKPACAWSLLYLSQLCFLWLTSLPGVDKGGRLHLNWALGNKCHLREEVYLISAKLAASLVFLLVTVESTSL